MNKSQLADAIAAESGISKTDARKALDALIKVTGNALSAGDKITVVGLGSLVVTRKSEVTGRNFITGAAIRVPAKNVVKFKASAELNSLLN